MLKEAGYGSRFCKGKRLVLISMPTGLAMVFVSAHVVSAGGKWEHCASPMINVVRTANQRHLVVRDQGRSAITVVRSGGRSRLLLAGGMRRFTRCRTGLSTAEDPAPAACHYHGGTMFPDRHQTARREVQSCAGGILRTTKS